MRSRLVVGVGVVLSGILRVFTGAVRPLVAERLKRAADKGFAATVDFEMKQYRELEAGWNTPNKCAKLEFGRNNRSLTLRRGDSGDETVKVNAFSGTATLDRTTPAVVGGPNGSYALASGGITYHLSGQEGLGVTGCQWSGTKVVELPVGSGSGSASVFGKGPEFTAPLRIQHQDREPAARRSDVHPS